MKNKTNYPVCIELLAEPKGEPSKVFSTKIEPNEASKSAVSAFSRLRPLVFFQSLYFLFLVRLRNGLSNGVKMCLGPFNVFSCFG